MLAELLSELPFPELLSELPFPELPFSELPFPELPFPELFFAELSLAASAKFSKLAELIGFAIAPLSKTMIKKILDNLSKLYVRFYLQTHMIPKLWRT